MDLLQTTHCVNSDVAFLDLPLGLVDSLLDLIVEALVVLPQSM
jgi:hypothetical protein